jgi:hypothetical protein
LRLPFPFEGTLHWKRREIRPALYLNGRFLPAPFRRLLYRTTAR